MKNLLVKSLFQIKDTNWHIRDRSNETDLYEKYLEMHRISVGSYKRHLKGEWELKFIQGTVENVNDAFKKTFTTVYDIWRQGGVNIFYTDPDTVAVQDIDPWAMSDHFMMFNYTDPKKFDQPNYWNRKFDNFFNAGVRLFPAGMSQSTWDIGLKMFQDWDNSTYDTEQIILNSMLWDQGLKLSQVLRPRWAYQAQWLPDQKPLWDQDCWNGICINQSLIVHTHSSRDIDKKLNLMKQLILQ
jgi:hypothetical protein